MLDATLEISDLQTHFRSGKNILKAVKGVSFSVRAGEILGIVGESGSGKSVTALSIMRLVEPPGEIAAGKIIFRDENETVNLLDLSEKQLEKILGNRIAMIFQDPMTSLNPVLSVGFQIAETLRVHRNLPKKAAKQHAVNLLKRVGVRDAERRINDYPHEFSGGMRQRVMIAMAIACAPRILIADEPTTALDVTIQAQILQILQELRRETGMSIVIITHDLGVVAQLADRVAVMYAGRVVEIAPVKAIFENPQHPYTRALVSSIPRLENPPRRLPTIEGAPPRISSENADNCSFFSRCSLGAADCTEKRPILKKIAADQFAACFVAQAGVFADD